MQSEAVSGGGSKPKSSRSRSAAAPAEDDADDLAIAPLSFEFAPEQSAVINAAPLKPVGPNWNKEAARIIAKSARPSNRTDVGVFIAAQNLKAKASKRQRPGSDAGDGGTGVEDDAIADLNGGGAAVAMDVDGEGERADTSNDTGSRKRKRKATATQADKKGSDDVNDAANHQSTPDSPAATSRAPLAADFSQLNLSKPLLRAVKELGYVLACHVHAYHVLGVVVLDRDRTVMSDSRCSAVYGVVS